MTTFHRCPGLGCKEKQNRAAAFFLCSLTADAAASVAAHDFLSDALCPPTLNPIKAFLPEGASSDMVASN